MAIVALVAALAGTAVAQEASTSAKPLTKKKVKKIADKRIEKAAPDLSVANAEQLGEVPAEQYQQRLFAVVNEDGTLARGTNAVSSEKAAAFIYDVTFDRDVQECAYGATVGRSDDVISLVGYATVASDPPNGVRVFTYNLAGAGAARPFHLQVSC